MAVIAINDLSYRKLRFITICLTTVQLPFGTFVGFEFGSGHLQLGLIALAIQTVVTFTQAHLWWRTMDGVK
jgi:hypothetical protein